MNTNTNSVRQVAWFMNHGMLGEPQSRHGGDFLRTNRSAPARHCATDTEDFTGGRMTGNDLFPGRETPAAQKPKPVIFVPMDLSADSFEAAKVGVNIARQVDGRLVLFHAVHLNLTPYGPANPVWLKTALRREAMEKAEPMMRFAQKAGVLAICAVEDGVQADAILQGAGRWEADMIVLTAHQRSWFARLFRRPTVDHVIRAAACPVMVLQMGRQRK